MLSLSMKKENFIGNYSPLPKMKFMLPEIHQTTAQYSNFPVLEAIETMTNDAKEGFGLYSYKHLQLCPQTPDVYCESLLSSIHKRLPDTQLRLHANIRVSTARKVIDVSNYGVHTRDYFKRISDLSRYISAPTYSAHSGRRNASLAKLFHQWEQIQLMFDCPVLIEGMYPSQKEDYFINSWNEYVQLMHSGCPYALDLSHLNIVAKHEGKRPQTVYDLVCHPNCLEIHLSHNNGNTDAHRSLSATHWKNVWWKESWLSGLKHRSSLPVHFSEGMLHARSHKYNRKMTIKT